MENGFPARRAASGSKGAKLRGIGIGCFLEVAGGMLDEVAPTSASPAPMALSTCISSAQAIGQGPSSTFPPLAAARLGVDVARVRLVQGDSDAVPAGTPTVASRSAMMVGSALALACDEAIARGKLVAEQLFEAAAADIELSEGHYRVSGTDLKMPILRRRRMAARKTLRATCQGKRWPRGLDNLEPNSLPRHS